MSTGMRGVIYGPVASWRLGCSLGVDPVSRAEKTCSFDCVYCQLGRTRHHTAERREFVPLARLVGEFEELPALHLDYVTFSGMAEPALASNLGEAIDEVKRRIQAPVAVLTNSSLMWKPEVRAALSRADKVVAKLDAPTEELLRAINRPVQGITLQEILSGIRALRDEYRGCLALQMMLFKDNQDQAEALAQLAREIEPDEVEVNTPLRPCAVKPLPPEALAEMMTAFRGLNALSVYQAERPAVRPLDMEETLQRRPVL
ncbi:MAG: radical SAM protein [Armatimonadota bacterium]|nr:MAG: radical SAM protein [Armatimonadota bacterium]